MQLAVLSAKKLSASISKGKLKLLKLASKRPFSWNLLAVCQARHGGGAQAHKDLHATLLADTDFMESTVSFKKIVTRISIN